MQTQQETIQLLYRGEITSLELSPWGSNYTFLVNVRLDSTECRAVYKPKRGEIPLWDFPSGTLYKRECAAYLLSRILGWDFVPFTVIREGPYGVGSLQLFVEHEPRINYFTLRESNPDDMRTIACFDLIANNADRKASHFIRGPDEKIWGIDHGLTFNSVIKVRTVIWDFGGEPIPDTLLEAASSLMEKLKSPRGSVKELARLLEEAEMAALAQRIEWLLEVREYPSLERRRR